MFGGERLRVAHSSVLTDTMRSHWETARKRKGTDVPDIQEDLGALPMQQVETILEGLARDVSRLQRIDGPLRPEGTLFTVVYSPSLWLSPTPWLVKLYHKTQLKSKALDTVINHLYPADRSTIFSRLNPFPQTPIAGKLQHRLQQSGNGPYFASAEIMVRTVAHTVSPDVFPNPVALVNTDQEAVGWMVQTAQPVVRARDMHRIDTFFDMPWDTPVWDDAATIPVRTRLEEANVHLYDETMADIRGQRLVDANGQFVTFARLGYRLSGV